MNRFLQDNDTTWRRLFWTVLTALTLFRLAIAGQFGFSTDESHYVLFARHPALGYFDHPPMVAFLGWLTGWLGDGEFYYRLGPIVCWAISAILMRRLALSLYRDERVAVLSLVFLSAMPVQHLLGMALLPDATLNLFWCATLLAAWHAMERSVFRTWLVTGVLFGAALLSKYHGVLLPACLFGFMLTSPARRRVLASPWPYIGLAAGLLVFAPNIIWNWQHGWISYLYQFGRGGTGSGPSVLKVVQSVGGQFAAASPILFALLLVTWVVLWRRRPLSDADRFVLWTSLPVFLFFCGIGVTGRSLPHWPAVGWWTGVVGLAALVVGKLEMADERGGRRWRRWVIAGGALGFTMVLLLYAAVAFPIVGRLHDGVRGLSVRLNRMVPAIPSMPAFRAKYDITNDLYGWNRAASEVERLRTAMPAPAQTFVFANRFYTSSQLGVYLPDRVIVTTIGKKRDQYRLWFKAADYEGWDALYVEDDRYPQDVGRYAGLFRRVERVPVQFHVMRREQVAQSFRIYRCYGYLGRYEQDVTR